MARQRADWMQPVDERIMETMRDYGNLTPQALDNLEVTSRSHASVRLSKLRSYGLVGRVADVEGLYQLTLEGEAFLDEELDAAELEPRE
nr:ArsR family transcriptional regulator [Haloparvum sedimenti]